MARTANFLREDRLGLTVALVAHIALAALFLVQGEERAALVTPERMVVSLADEVSLESTAPDPSAEPAASYAPALADVPAPPVAAAADPAERTVPREVPQPAPVAAPRPEPTRQPRTETPRPRPAAARPSSSAPTPAPAPAVAASAPTTPRERTGGSRIGADFLEGRSNSEGRAGSPATAFGASEAASLNSAIARQLKPHWQAPSGVDADQLVTIVRFRLERNGSLQGAPSCVSQTGVTPSNTPQKDLHCERAIRAVRTAAPFNLPDQFYEHWRLVNSRFDRRL